MADNLKNLAENSWQSAKPRFQIKKSASMGIPAHRAFRKQAPKKVGYLSQVLNKRIASKGLVVGTALILFGGMMLRNQYKNESSTYSISQLAENSYKDLFQKGPVFYVWGLFWFRVFQKQQIHDSLLSLLIGAINEPQFVSDSALFGQKWIEHCVQQKPVIDQSIILSEQTFVKDQEVVAQATRLCEWFAVNPKVQEISTNMMSQTCSRNDVFDIMMWQLSCAAYTSSYQPEGQEFVKQNSIEVMNNEKIQKHAIEEVKSTFSLGLIQNNMSTI